MQETQGLVSNPAPQPRAGSSLSSSPGCLMKGRGCQALAGDPSGPPWLRGMTGLAQSITPQEGTSSQLYPLHPRGPEPLPSSPAHGGLSRAPPGAHPPGGGAVVEKHRMRFRRARRARTTLAELPAPAGPENERRGWERAQE